MSHVYIVYVVDVDSVCLAVCALRTVKLGELDVIVKEMIAVKLKNVCVLLINCNVSLEYVGIVLLASILRGIIVKMIRF